MEGVCIHMLPQVTQSNYSGKNVPIGYHLVLCEEEGELVAPTLLEYGYSFGTGILVEVISEVH